MAEIKSPAFQFYYKEWLTGTKGMCRIEKDIYLTLLIFQFDLKNKLKADNENLFRICEIKNKKEKICLKYVCENKFRIIDGFLINNKMANTIEDANKFKEKQALNGSKGGRGNKAKPLFGFDKMKAKESSTSTSVTISEDIVLKQKTFENLKIEMFSSEVWISDNARISGLSIEKIKSLLHEFLNEIYLRDEIYKSLKETKNHFVLWYKKERLKPANIISNHSHDGLL